MKKDYGVLTPAKTEKKNTVWDEMFNLLKEYSHQHGELPSLNTVYSYKVIGQWVANQRRLYKDGHLSQAKVQKLLTIDKAILETKDTKWDENCNELKRYVEDTGRLPFFQKKEIEFYFEALKAVVGISTQIELSTFFNVPQSAVSGWIKRDSVKTLRDYIIKKGLDIKTIEEKIEALKISSLSTKYQLNPSLFSEIFQSVFDKNKDVILNILLDSLPLVHPPLDEPVVDVSSQLLKDFDTLVSQIVSPKIRKERLSLLQNTH